MARKVSKKQRRSKSRRATRKMRGGYYGFNGAVGTGAPSYARAEEVPLAGGRRHKGSKKSRRRKMRGGGSYGAVSGSFTGEGHNGLANMTAVNQKSDSGPAALGAFNVMKS
jgi:hypothetical protein